MSNLVKVYENSNVTVCISYVEQLDNYKTQHRLCSEKEQKQELPDEIIENIETAVQLFNAYGGTLIFTPSDTSRMARRYTTLTPEQYFSIQTKKEYLIENKLESNVFSFIATKNDGKEKIFFLKQELEFNLKTIQEWEDIVF